MKNLTVTKLKCTWNKYNNNENNYFAIYKTVCDSGFCTLLFEKKS